MAGVIISALRGVSDWTNHAMWLCALGAVVCSIASLVDMLFAGDGVLPFIGAAAFAFAVIVFGAVSLIAQKVDIYLMTRQLEQRERKK